MERQARFCMVLLLLSFVSYSMGRQLEQPLIKAVVNDEEQGCNYIILTQTSDKKKASTDAKVGISLCTSSDTCFLTVPDIAKYGDRGPNYAYYFDRAVYSRFRLTTNDWCTPICKIVVTLDGKKRDSWLVDTVEVQSLNTYGAKKYYGMFPIYGKVTPDQSVTADQCAIQLDNGKTLDVAGQGVTRIFTTSLVAEEIIA